MSIGLEHSIEAIFFSIEVIELTRLIEKMYTASSTSNFNGKLFLFRRFCAELLNDFEWLKRQEST